MDVPTWVWIATLALLSTVLLVDVAVIGRRPHMPSRRETGTALAVYVGLAVLFGLGVWFFAGPGFAAQFYAGWLTEYSLSVDNLFVFIVILGTFRVPGHLQQAALMIGIIIALVLRGAFIAAGAVAIEQFSWVFYLFGAFLVWTAVRLARSGGEDEEFEQNRLMLWVERRLPATSSWDGGTRLVVRQAGRRVVTPMLLVVLALGTTDLLFALDSIPAIYGLTEEPYLVLTANVFALMGLRQLYFLIGGLLERLVYLSLGLAVLLGFIGVKLVLQALAENEVPFVNGGEPVPWAPELPTWVSLVAIVVVLGVTTVASLVVDRRRGGRPAPPAAPGPAGTGSTAPEARVDPLP
ncbi:TerC family protein [Jannaschia sp. R86511]|uniref:TerC family protein n=1 Tax=Jannaschia sp. R86511 TaxID=3093853 RepID=UPI0036D37785